MYYNTNNEQGQTLEASRKKAKTQEEEILYIFEENPEANLSPDGIQRILSVCGYPITSIRRSLTNLTKQNKIEKTDVMVEGEYGKKVHTWRLKLVEVEEDGQTAIKF